MSHGHTASPAAAAATWAWAPAPAPVADSIGEPFEGPGHHLPHIAEKGLYSCS